MNNEVRLCKVSEKCTNCELKNDCYLYTINAIKTEQRINVGYKIIKSVKLEEEIEFVLGEKLDATLNKYVTWIYNYNCYHHGHYFKEYEDAILDFYQRVEKECNYIVEKLNWRRFNDKSDV